MFSTGDLLPQQSGSASIGVATNGLGNFTTNIKPYAHVHMNSGVLHDGRLGSSGVLRFAQQLGNVSVGGGLQNHYLQNAIELSPDGGVNFPVRIGGDNNHGVIQSLDDSSAKLFILTSGNLVLFSQSSLDLDSLGVTTIDANLSILIRGHGDDGSTVSLSTDRGGEISLEALNPTNLAVPGDITIVTDDSNILLLSGDAEGTGKGGQIELNAFASSGRLQYRFGPHQAWYAKLTHASTGGPANDGFWPLPHSGQIAQMIAQSTPGGSVDLQQAYDNGNEIDSRRDLIGYKGILVRETSPGFNGGFTNNEDIAVNKPGKYGIAVSGHTLTPDTPNSYGLSALNSLSLMIASSGSVSALSRNFFLGYAAANANTVFFNTNGSLRFVVGDTTGAGTDGQIDFRAFGGSGRLDYRFGPHQGWAERLTHSSVGGPANDGYWPLVNSGQMLEQIARAIKTKAMTVERPAVNNDLTIWYTNEAITIDEVESVCRGSFDASGQFAIRYAADRSLAGTELTTTAITCTSRTTGQITTSFAAPNIPADNWIWIGVSGVSGVATSQLGVTIQYR